MFFVLRGSLLMRLPDRVIVVDEGEFLIVPRGVEHQPVAAQEVHVLLFEQPPAPSIPAMSGTNAPLRYRSVPNQSVEHNGRMQI